MELKEALEILDKYKMWLGSESDTDFPPTQVYYAIDTVLQWGIRITR